ncbi:DUF1028 domain-containing protein [Roseomonas sp. F4]
MTFSLIARCARTGQFGAAATTSSLAVGARVHAVAPGVGAVLTQHRTDPRLGPRGLGLLRSGCTAEQTVAALVASTPDHGWRQLAAIDAAGRTAHFHGRHVKREFGAAHGPDVVAIGNILSSDQVPAAMVAGFCADPDLPLAERLVRGLEAGEAAGGEHGEVRSASLLVYGPHDFALVDLRADGHAQPIPALRALWEEYAPLVEAYVVRVLNPDDAIAL